MINAVNESQFHSIATYDSNESLRNSFHGWQWSRCVLFEKAVAYSGICCEGTFEFMCANDAVISEELFLVLGSHADVSTFSDTYDTVHVRRTPPSLHVTSLHLVLVRTKVRICTLDDLTQGNR